MSEAGFEVPASLLIVDDSRNFLEEAARELDAQGLRVIGCASTSDEALQLVDAEVPDVVLVDLDLGTEDGLQLIPKLLRLRRDMSVILISAWDPDDVEEVVAGSGALGFLPKERLNAEEILALLG